MKLDTTRLSSFFAAEVPGCAGPLTAEIVLGGRSNLVFRVTDGRSRWILRRPPLGLVAPSANDVAREFRAVVAMSTTAVPVPRPVVLCESPDVIGAPFSVVSEVAGQVVRSDEDGRRLGPEAAGCGLALVDGLASLALVDPESPAVCGLGRPSGYLARQLQRWRGQWDLVHTRELVDLGRLFSLLEAHLPISSHAGVVHGDYRLDNVLFAADDPSTIVAVIDWEMATLGDPLVDLGLLLIYWDPICAPILGGAHPVSANPAFPTEDTLIERFATRTGWDVTDLAFYVALGAFKLAIIGEGIHRRFVDGDAVGEDFDRVGAAVAPLLAKGVAALSGRSSRRQP